MKRSAALRLMLMLLIGLGGGLSKPVNAQELSQEQAWALDLAYDYDIRANVTYLRANNVDLKMDLYLPRRAEVRGPVPTIMYIHGGGWVFGRKEGAGFSVLPYLAKGWAAVNVEYRMSDVSHAPAAVEDVRCALRWITDRADELGLDKDKFVVTGHSAGGHLSLAAGLIPSSEGLDNACPGSDEPLKVAAVINWYGISDVEDLLEGPNRKTYAVAWLGSRPDREEVARRVSPIHYVNAASPPVLSIHGDADDVVPYSHSVRLHEALQAAGVPNSMITIPGGGHGGFSREEQVRAFREIERFLDLYVESGP